MIPLLCILKKKKGIEVSDFEQHFHDYSQYCQLEQQKKALIRDWRKTRENLKEKAIREESEVSDNSSDNLVFNLAIVKCQLSLNLSFYDILIIPYYPLIKIFVNGYAFYMQYKV